MDDVTIGVFTLTVHHLASHYGIPVLCGEDGRAYGPADPINTPETDAMFGAEPFPAIRVVVQALRHMTPAQATAARLYCQQWPEGWRQWQMDHPIA
jgi:uncharacterized membrane protein